MIYDPSLVQGVDSELVLSFLAVYPQWEIQWVPGLTLPVVSQLVTVQRKFSLRYSKQTHHKRVISTRNNILELCTISSFSIRDTCTAEHKSAKALYRSQNNTSWAKSYLRVWLILRKSFSIPKGMKREHIYSVNPSKRALP